MTQGFTCAYCKAEYYGDVLGIAEHTLDHAQERLAEEQQARAELDVELYLEREAYNRRKQDAD